MRLMGIIMFLFDHVIIVTTTMSATKPVTGRGERRFRRFSQRNALSALICVSPCPRAPQRIVKSDWFASSSLAGTATDHAGDSLEHGDSGCHQRLAGHEARRDGDHEV